MSLIETSLPATAGNLKNALVGRGDTQIMLLKIFCAPNKQMETIVGRGYAPVILERYRTSYDHNQAFIQWKYRVGDLNIKDLNYEFISDCECWHKSINQCSQNNSI